MSDERWKRLKVIVELPVQGDVTERDFRFAVERALQTGNLEVRLRERHIDAKTGRMQVKSFSRYIAKVDSK